MNKAIPQIHYRPAEEKLTRKWWAEAMNLYVHNGGLRYLTHGKDVKKIEEFASGNFDTSFANEVLITFRKDWYAKNGMPSPEEQRKEKVKKTKNAVALLPPKLQSAESMLQKQSFEVNVQCLDPLAQKRKQKDLEFLREKPKMEAEMREMYNAMDLGEPDLGSTEYSATPYYAAPFGLDFNNEHQFKIFAEFYYNYRPSFAYRTALNAFAQTRNLYEYRRLSFRDQFKYGVSVIRSLEDQVTGLPDVKVHAPYRVMTDYSELPDFSDNTIRIIDESNVTPEGLKSMFPDEIPDEVWLNNIVNSTDESLGLGYAIVHKRGYQKPGIWSTYPMLLQYVEIKTIDSIGFVETKTEYGTYKYFSNDEEKITGKIIAQNTMCAYWLYNTKWFFGIDRLPFAFREKGKETYTRFSSVIQKSAEISAVELSIPENEMAQIAFEKLKFELQMSLPSGQSIDLSGLIDFIEAQTDEDDKYAFEEVLMMALTQNRHLWTSKGFEGKMNGQYKPVQEVVGGVRYEAIRGYYDVIERAKAAISNYTSITPQMTGQKVEELNGLQQMALEASVNGIAHIADSVRIQYEKVYHLVAYYIKKGVESGGKVKEAIKNLIGQNKVDLIDKMDELTLHDAAVSVRLGRNELEQRLFVQNVMQLKAEGIIDELQEVFIMQVADPYDAALLMATQREIFNKKKEESEEKNRQVMLTMKEQEGKNMADNTQLAGNIKAQQIQLEGMIEMKLLELAASLNLTQAQQDGIIRRQLQRDRQSGNVAAKTAIKQFESNLKAQSQTA